MTSISLVIPIYNEATHLPEFLAQIDALSFAAMGLEKELVFVDDCSTDASLAILRAHVFASRAQVIVQEKNQGKGAALRRGIALATGEIIAIQDADFEYKMTELPQLVQPVVAGECDIVYGSRFTRQSRQVHRTFHYLVNRFLTLLSNLFSGLYLSDMETCYKIFRAEIIQNAVLESDRFGFEPEITAKIARLKVRVHELPVSYFPRNYLEGKKITWRDGLRALYEIVYFNLCADRTKFFTEKLPSKYRVRSSQWL